MARQLQVKRLLFVDDEPSIRFTLASIFQQKGFDVRVAANVPEALVEMEKTHFDVLLTDLNITEPDDGFKVVSAMRRRHPKCIKLILTGYPEFESAVQAIRHQVDDYFIKPADIDAILNSIEQKLKSS